MTATGQGGKEFLLAVRSLSLSGRCSRSHRAAVISTVVNLSMSVVAPHAVIPDPLPETFPTVIPACLTANSQVGSWHYCASHCPDWSSQ